MKTCTVCRVAKAPDLFPRNKNAKDGRHASCKECQAEWMRAYRRSHPERKRESGRKWYAANKDRVLTATAAWKANNRDRTRELNRQYEARNRDRIRERRRKRSKTDRHKAARARWYERNHAKMAAYAAKWRAENPDKVRQHHRRSYAKLSATSYFFEKASTRRAAKRAATIQKFTSAQLRARMSVFGDRCAYCGGPFEHIDHVKPLSRGGPHCLSNLRPACQACNVRKHNKPLLRWLSERRK